MFEINENNKRDFIKLLNMIICEMPFIKSFNDDCLLERLLSLISIVTNAFDYQNSESLNSNVFDTEEERENAIREWLLRHYNAKSSIDDLNFNDEEDRARVAALIINILFKLRHSLKDIEQYLKDCNSFVHIDEELNRITRYDKLLEIIENDCNRWKSEASNLKMMSEESQKLIDKYQQNEIFNYNCNPRNQNLYKSRISINKETDQSSEDSSDPSVCKQTNGVNSDDCQKSLAKDHIKEVINVSEAKQEVNKMDVIYPCIECDEKYCTKYEFNIHVLKVHKQIDTSLFDINCKNFNNNNKNNNNSNHVLPSEESTERVKKCDNNKRLVFRCVYNKCGKVFHKSNDLKTHFVRHQTNIDRYLCVYSDYTNAVLNHTRTQSLKSIRVPSNYEHKLIPKKIKINSNENKCINKYNMNLKTQNYEFNSGFRIDSHLNHSNNLHSVPICQNEGVVPFSNYNSIDSFDYMNESTDEEIDSNGTKVEFFSHLEDKLNLKTLP